MKRIPKPAQRMIDHPAFVKQRQMRAKLEPPMGSMRPDPPTMPTKAKHPIQVGKKPKK